MAEPATVSRASPYDRGERDFIATQSGGAGSPQWAKQKTPGGMSPGVLVSTSIYFCAACFTSRAFSAGVSKPSATASFAAWATQLTY